MPRKREIKPSFYMDEDLAECSVWARLLFPALWQLADREGRLEDRPAMIRIHAFPYDNLEGMNLSVHEMINELARPRKHCPDGDAFLVRYVVGGRGYIQIKNFKVHQRCHPNEVGSEIPPYEKVTARSTKVDSTVHQGDTRSRLQSKPSKPSSSLATDTAAGASGGRPTWLTKPGELWRARFGAESEPPWGEMSSAFAKPLKAFEARGERDELWARWERFLAAAERSTWARPSRFIQGLGEWGPSARGQPGASVPEKNAKVLDEWEQEVREGKR